MNTNDAENTIELLTDTNKLDPMDFDVTVSALLIGLGAERYVDIFRQNRIGQSTLVELTDTDLVQLGVDNAEIRSKLLEEVKNLPIYEEASEQICVAQQNLTPMEIAEILEESSQHLYRVYLSILANTLTVKKTKKITDCLLHRDKYSSDIAIATLSEINNILNSMDISLHTQMKTLTQDTNYAKNKKIVVGSIGTVAIATLAFLFVRSLRQFNK